MRSFFLLPNQIELSEVEPVNAEELNKQSPNGQVIPTVAMRLCYNKLNHLSSNLIANLDSLSHGHARALRWIDLSFNQLSSIQVCISFKYISGREEKEKDACILI